MVLSCGIPVVPKSVDITGKPGLYLPLGSPFSKLEEGERLEDYVNPAKIREMMNAAKDENDGSMKDLRVYDYWPDSAGEDIQTYAVHYPIAEMKRDLTEYMREASIAERGDNLSITISESINSIPNEVFPIYLTEEILSNLDNFLSDPGSAPPNNPDAPLFSIRLPDMARLVREIRGRSEDGSFGIEMEYNQSFYEKLRVKIPAFGIDDYQQGVEKDGKLQFVNSAKTTFIPADDLEKKDELEEKKEFLKIYVQLVGPCSGPAEFNLIFDWEEAVIDTTHGIGTLSGEYSIETSFRDFLGEGVYLKEMQGFIYVDGLGDDEGTMTLDANGVTLFPDSGGVAALTQAERPDFPVSETEPMTTDLLQCDQSLSRPIDLAPALNEAEEILELEYEVKILEWTLKNDPEQTEGIITVDMVILLPLEFIVTTESTEPGYVELEMGDKFLNPDDEDEDEDKDDLFGRKGNDDDLFSNIDTVAVFVKKFRNTIIGNTIFVLLESPLDEGDLYKRTIDLDLGKKEIFITIEYEDLPNPFIPRFKTLLKKDTDKDIATLRIKRQLPNIPPEFDFFLAVEARTDLNINLF